MTNTSRRSFLKFGALAGSGLLLSKTGVLGSQTKMNNFYSGNNQQAGDELLSLSSDLLKRWGEGLVSLQVQNPNVKGLHGGILCPACGTIHGRSGDAIFPLLFLAGETKDEKYLRAATDLYQWMEDMVSLPDGSWVNEVSVSSWKGITVFGAIALAEAIIHFGHLLDKETKNKWIIRLDKAGNYLYNDFTIHTGNINYPITCSYALSLLGQYLDRKHYMDKGKELAHQSLSYFTKKDRLLFGEGHPTNEISPKGCYSIDLGYNVEESLPALVLYGKLTGDTEVLDVVTESLKAHLEFMLPDGAWDNSWGTRNFKWTYWGSRTSDGCQSAFALMTDADPAFYKAALMNTKLLKACTHDNLLHGGPHYVNHGILPCVNHTLGHSKALTTILIKQEMVKHTPDTDLLLPRERNYGVKTFRDINTWIISKDNWKGTITGFDHEYSMKSGHPTGGALTMLWHYKTGPLIVGSMNQYQLVEPFNMQRDKDSFSMSLTPRFEAEVDHKIYSNINDLKALIDFSQDDKEIKFETRSHLVDEDQKNIPWTAGACEINYSFKDDAVVIHAKRLSANVNELLKYFLPIVSCREEKITIVSGHQLEIHKPNGIVTIQANIPIKMLNMENDRIFNFVPGMEAIALELKGNEMEITISVK